MSKFYVTTAIDYVNDVIHIGHAYQKILADALARYHRQIGNETFFLTGTDEHGSKTETTAQEHGITPKQLADEVSIADQKQLDALNLSYDRFIRTTDADHVETAREFYLKIYENGDLYEGSYTGIYCVGCEDFLTEKDLTDGKCPEHPTQEPTQLTEKNFFFKWSKYEDFLRGLLEENSEFLIPESRRNEMLAFLDQGLQDIPFTRPKERVGFGIEVPHDPSQTIYVWADALVNYVSGNPKAWTSDDTTIVHLLGKNNVRFHALLWPAMLKSAGYRLPDTVYGHDFFTIDGTKISKSLGNVIRPTELVEQFGADAVRYFFLRYGPLKDDVDVTIERIKEVYNADLANGLGNLVSRVAKMAEGAGAAIASRETSEVSGLTSEVKELARGAGLNLAAEFHRHLENFRVDLTLELIWQKIAAADKFVDHNRVWEQEGKEKEASLEHLVQEIREISTLLRPFMPETADKIQEQFQGPKIKSTEPLFPRL